MVYVFQFYNSRCNFIALFQIEDKEEWNRLLDLVKNNEAPADAPPIPDPSTANDGEPN